MAQQTVNVGDEKQLAETATLTQRVSTKAIHASKVTLKGWTKFRSWERNGEWLRTIGGLLCIGFCLNWAIAGATFAFLFTTYTAMMESYFDAVVTTTWDVLSVHTKIAVLLSGIFIVISGSYVAFLLFPIQVIGSLCAFKLGLDLAVKNMNRHVKTQ